MTEGVLESPVCATDRRGGGGESTESGVYSPVLGADISPHGLVHSTQQSACVAVQTHPIRQ